VSFQFLFTLELWHLVPVITTLFSVYVFVVVVQEEFTQDAFLMALILWCGLTIPALFVAYLK